MPERMARRYFIERDADGMPTELSWRGDVPAPAKKTKAELDRERLDEYERVYGKRGE
jgi:hypothetical protein